uniref:Ankyrin repeat and SOCS box containing 1 n=1 Tax=Capra hircus TaxID=9925 RepID=A0A8C2R601_CAPHI
CWAHASFIQGDFLRLSGSGRFWKQGNDVLLLKVGEHPLGGKGCPGGSGSKETACNAETRVLSLGWKNPLEREWQPTPVLLPGAFYGQRSLAGYSPWGRQEWDTTAGLTLSWVGGAPCWLSRQGLLELTGAPLFSAGPNLKEWLREQFCDHPLEHCEDTRLHDAAYVGDLQTLRSLLQEESYRSRINEKSVWCCGWLPCTPLRIAATAGHGNCVDFLIRKGAEVDLVDVKGQTALYVAVVNGHLESAQILLEAGADPNGSRHHRSTPVYHASRVGRADILKALIRYGADVDVNHHLTPDAQPPFSRRLTSLVVCPLYISAAYHNLQCFKLLLQAGANPDFNCNGPVNTQGFYRGSPGCVMDAVLRHGCEAAFVSLLVEFGANLNLVKWESLGPESRGRRKVDPEALQVFKEARRWSRAWPQPWDLSKLMNRKSPWSIHGAATSVSSNNSNSLTSKLLLH